MLSTPIVNSFKEFLEIADAGTHEFVRVRLLSKWHKGIPVATFPTTPSQIIEKHNQSRVTWLYKLGYTEHCYFAEKSAIKRYTNWVLYIKDGVRVYAAANHHHTEVLDDVEFAKLYCQGVGYYDGHASIPLTTTVDKKTGEEYTLYRSANSKVDIDNKHAVIKMLLQNITYTDRLDKDIMGHILSGLKKLKGWSELDAIAKSVRATKVAREIR